MNLSHAEKTVYAHTGGIKVIALAAICFPLAYYFQPAIFLPDPILGRQDQLKWFIPLVGNLIWRVLVITDYRSSNEKCIDGSAFTKVEPIELTVLRALLQNALEQTFLLVVTHLIWIFCMPHKFLVLQPVALIFFLLGRISYARGYTKSTQGRAFGFALGFVSTALLFLMEVVWFIGTTFLPYFK
jgi:hypothetical protein